MRRAAARRAPGAAYSSPVSACNSGVRSNSNVNARRLVHPLRLGLDVVAATRARPTPLRGARSAQRAQCSNGVRDARCPPLELVMEQGPTACYRAPMRPHLPALLSLMVVISCRDGDDHTATEPGSTSATSTSTATGSSTSLPGAQRALGETCDPNAGDDECAAGLFCDFPQCGSSELTWFGFCSPVDCVTDDDCATVDGLKQVCDKYEEPGFTASWCRWNCVTDADCPNSLVSNLTCQPFGLNQHTCQAPCPEPSK